MRARVHPGAILADVYEVRPTLATDAPALNALYRRLTGLARTHAQWEWEWCLGPEGRAPSFVFVHRASGVVVGHHGVVPVPLSLGSRDIRAARTENSMVDPAHRGKFPYTAFEATLLRDFLKQYDIIFTTAGGGTPGAIRKRLGYTEIGKWQSFAAAPRPSYVAARLLPGGSAFASALSLFDVAVPRRVEIDPYATPADIAALWERWRIAYPIAPARTAALLQWRIAEHPYTHFCQATVHRDGTPFAALIWRERIAGRVARDLAIEDVFVADRAGDDYRDALLALAGHYRGRGTRVTVRTLAGDDPLARAAAGLSCSSTLVKGRGSPFLARGASGMDVTGKWSITMLVSQGI